MSDHYTRWLNHQRRFISTIISNFAFARSQKKSHAWLTDRYFHDVVDKDAYQKAPRWMKEYVSGYHAGLVQSLWHHDVIWVLWFRGQFFTGSQLHDLQKKYDARGEDVRVWKEVNDHGYGMFVWRDPFMLDGTVKHFTGGKE